MANPLRAGLIIVRKPGKLPAETDSVSYELEYGVDSLEMHRDAFEKGDKVLIVDDLLATGGTAKAAKELIERSGAQMIGFSFMIELTFLKGREKLGNTPIYNLIQY